MQSDRNAGVYSKHGQWKCYVRVENVARRTLESVLRIEGGDGIRGDISKPGFAASNSTFLFLFITYAL